MNVEGDHAGRVRGKWAGIGTRNDLRSGRARPVCARRRGIRETRGKSIRNGNCGGSRAVTDVRDSESVGTVRARREVARVALGQSEIRGWSETSKSDDHAIARPAESVDQGAHGGEVRRLSCADNVHAAGINSNPIEAISACATKIRGEQ